MHDDVATMPCVLDVLATPPLMIMYSDTYSQIKSSLIVWYQCDYISMTSEIIYELNHSCCRSKHLTKWVDGRNLFQ